MNFDVCEKTYKIPADFVIPTFFVFFRQGFVAFCFGTAAARVKGFARSRRLGRSTASRCGSTMPGLRLPGAASDARLAPRQPPQLADQRFGGHRNERVGEAARPGPGALHRCRACLASGVDGIALPGQEWCHVHAPPTPAPVARPGPVSAADAREPPLADGDEDACDVRRVRPRVSDDGGGILGLLNGSTQSAQAAQCFELQQGTLPDGAPSIAMTVEMDGSETQPASSQQVHAMHAAFARPPLQVVQSCVVSCESIEATLSALTIVRIDGSHARLGISYRRQNDELKHRCQLGTAPRCTGPSMETPVQAVRAWFERFKGGLAPQTVATIGAHLDGWECRAPEDDIMQAAHHPLVDVPPVAPEETSASQPVIASNNSSVQRGSWLHHLPLMDDVTPEHEWLHPVPTIAKVPQELEAAVLDIFELLWTTIAEAARAQDTVAQARAERLWHVIPKMLFAQPQRPRERSEEIQHVSNQAGEVKAVQARLQLFFSGQWRRLLDLAEALWPLHRERKAAQVLPTCDGDAARRRADAVISKCSNSGTSAALQLLMSPGVAPCNARTVERVRETVSRHRDRPLPPRTWVTNHIGQAAPPESSSFKRTLKRGKRGGAQDLGGWRYEYIQLALLRTSAFDALYNVTSLLATCKCLDATYDLFVYGKCTPIWKGIDGVRPLVCGSLFRRIAMSSLCSERKQRFAQHLGVENYAVGIKGALEKISVSLSCLAKLYPDHVFMEFDAEAAFCSMYREEMLEEMAECAPDMIALQAQWLTRETKAVMFVEQGAPEIIVSSVGADQGCSGSPVAFAMGMRRVLNRLQTRMRALAASLPASAARRELQRILGYLDDLLVIAPRHQAPQVARLVEESLSEAGLSINWTKSRAWCPSSLALPDGMPMPASNGGLVMCGAPTLAAALDEHGDLDWEHACPVGSDEFVEEWLSKLTTRIDKVLAAILALPFAATIGRPSVQVANLLLRQCVVQKVMHVLRLVDPSSTRDWARDVDSRVVKAWCALNNSHELSHSQIGLLRAPLREGGLGILSLESAADAGFAAACFESAKHVRSVIPEEYELDIPGLEGTAEHLHDAWGVDMWALAGVTRANICSYDGDKFQRCVMAKVTDFVVARWKHWASPLELAIASSAASGPGFPGSNDWLTARPTSKKCAFPDQAARVLQRWRLRSRLVEEGAECAYTIRTHNRVCSHPLTPFLDHVFHCCRAHVVGRHDKLRDIWTAIYTQAGCHALPERRGIGAAGPCKRADIIVSQGLLEPQRWTDVMVTHPLVESQGVWTGCGAGAAVVAAEAQKRREYRAAADSQGALVVPLCVESYGRWGEAAVSELRRLAKLRGERSDARATCDAEQVRSSSLSRWRRELSCGLMQGNALILLSAAPDSLGRPGRCHAAPASAPTLSELLVDS